MSKALRRFALPVLGLCAVSLLALTAGFLTAAGPADNRAGPPEAEAPPPVTAVRGVIQQLNGDQVTLTTSSGGITVRLAPGSIIETLGATTTLHLAVGDDWLNVGAVGHPQTLFAINGLVVISEGPAP
ncbi:MAG: hypothetical protein GEU75_12765 [Dehalococcoidia bacterium]|nr:hypothetical protein [Dehalococcoidia bacterium]